VARTRTLLLLRADVRYQADLESLTDRHTDATLTRLINQSYARFRELLSEAGHSYYLTTSTGSCVAGTATIDLPNDFVALYGVDLTVDGETRELQEHTLLERNRFGGASVTGVPVTFRMQGSTKITLVPTPDAAYAYSLLYLPTHTELSTDEHTVDGINGWEDWIVYDVGLKCLTRDDDDEQWQKLAALQADMEQRIRAAAPKRSRVGPHRRIDTRGMRRRNEHTIRGRWYV
jgi:hypothetical protein